MNAEIDFWCKRPENLKELDIKDWKALTGGIEDNCQILNITYGELTAIEAMRWVQELTNTLISHFFNPTQFVKILFLFLDYQMEITHQKWI